MVDLDRVKLWLENRGSAQITKAHYDSIHQEGRLAAFDEIEVLAKTYYTRGMEHGQALHDAVMVMLNYRRMK